MNKVQYAQAMYEAASGLKYNPNDGWHQVLAVKDQEKREAALYWFGRFTAIRDMQKGV